MNGIRICSVETEKNFIFCCHYEKKNKLVITDNKDPEGDDTIIEVDFCPFCGSCYDKESVVDIKHFT